MWAAIRGFESEITTLFWSLLCVELIFVLAFIWFSIVFFLHFKALGNEYKIKERFNIITQFSSINKFAYLESLARNNKQLLPLITNIKSNKSFFDKQLETLRKKIIFLTETNSKYQYAKSKKIISEIQIDLMKCEVMMKKLKDISSSATEYSKNVCNLIVEYRGLTNDIINFYQMNLSLRYTDEIFKNLHMTIEDTLSESSKFIIKINNDELMILLTQLNKHVTNFYQMTINLYVYDHILFYLNALQNATVLSFKNNTKSLSSSDQVSIERLLATADNNIHLMTNALSKINVNSAKDNSIIALKNLMGAKNKIESGEKSRILIQKDMHFLNSQITILSKQIKDILVAFTNIKKYFDTKDPFIKNKINQLMSGLSNITLAFQSLQLEYKDLDSIQSHNFLEKIHSLCWNIVKWCTDLNVLIDDIKDKYKTSIKINNDLADMKLTLVQSLFIKQHSDEYEQNMASVNDLIKHIEALQHMLAANYFGNYALVNKEIDTITQQMQLLFQKLTFDQTLKIYAQRLIFFLNKYRNEHEEINKIIIVAETSYKQQKYQQSIDILIDALTNIKDSAKMNHISMN